MQIAGAVSVAPANHLKSGPPEVPSGKS